MASTGLADDGSAVLGIDIGASKVVGRLCTSRGLAAEARAGGANVSASSKSLVFTQLEELVQRLGSPAHIVSVCAGAAGAGSEKGRGHLLSLLRGFFPQARLKVVSDAHLVLPAAGYQSGIAVVAGTGSIAYGFAEDGREWRVGGWGYLLGDEGSGYWIVREALRAVLEEADRGLPPNALATVMFRELGVSTARDLREAVYASIESSSWANHAPAVFEAAVDEVSSARDIVRRAARHLTDMTCRVRDQLGPVEPIVLAGGLILGQPLLQFEMYGQLAMTLPGAEVLVLAAPPVLGAVRLAELEVTRT